MQKGDSLLWRKNFAVFLALCTFSASDFARAYDLELEPNDESANSITPGVPMRGTISRYEDMKIKIGSLWILLQAED